MPCPVTRQIRQDMVKIRAYAAMRVAVRRVAPALLTLFGIICLTHL
jgi:hypothetical protein